LIQGGIGMAMEINTNYKTAASTSTTTSKSSSKTSSKAAKTEKDTTEVAATYEKSSQVSNKASYSINKMSEEDRAALVKQLKADQANREQSFLNIVSKTLTGQANAFSMSSDDMWKQLASGNFTVDAATKAQAQKDISADGYYGVEQTSQRLFDFASALAGDDVDKMKEMQNAMLKGFKEATKTWGKDLPDICQKTLDAANQLFENYYNSKTETE